MTILILGLSVFFAVHLFPMQQQWRSALINKWGVGVYKGLYSLIALSGLVLIVLGYQRAPFIFLYPEWSAARYLAMPVMFIVLYLFIGRRAGSNIRRWTANPMLWAVGLWAAVHLLANGDLASTLLFGSFLLYSIISSLVAIRRGARPVADITPVRREIVILLVVAVVFAALLWAHEFYAGVALLR